ncbi:MAG TPA: hypothetical protein VNV16_10140 [Methylibium sp.]|nr:hypothetical protein [Methylibium sp.]
MHRSLQRSLPLRALLALWLLLGLLAGPVLAARHAGAMASGQLVCSAAGAYVVGADGELLPAEGLGAHDCCQAASSAPPPPLPLLATAVPAPAEPLAQPVARHECAVAALPPARGPPQRPHDRPAVH